LFVNALAVVLPYGVAMKVATVAGPVLLPVAAWSVARGWRLPFPTGALFAVASVIFVFDSTAAWGGGTIRSVLAGDYSHALAALLGVLALATLGVVVREGRLRVLTALLFAASALAHPLGLLFGLVALVAVITAHCGRDWRTPILRIAPIAGVGLAI